MSYDPTANARLSLLTHYISEKNKQLQIFIERERELQDTYFGRHHSPFGHTKPVLSSSKYLLQNQAFEDEEDAPYNYASADSAATPARFADVSPKGEIADSQTAEIIKLCQELKTKLDKQVSEIDKMKQDMGDFEKVQRIRNEMLFERLLGLGEEIGKMRKDATSASEMEENGKVKEYVIDETHYPIPEIVVENNSNGEGFSQTFQTDDNVEN